MTDKNKRQSDLAGENHSMHNPLLDHVQKLDAINEDIIDTDEVEKQERMQRKNLSSVTTRESSVTEIGWYNVDMTKLGYDGKLYPADLQMIYRAARTAEIRHWSNLDDDANVLAAANHIVDMISVCVRCVSKSGDNIYSPKDIYEHDKWKLLLLIHELTFPETSALTNPIVFNISSASCKHSFKLNLSAFNIDYVLPDKIETFDKYIDIETGKWDVVTKNYGTYSIKPPTIGVASIFTDYMKTLTRDEILLHQKNIMSAQWMALEWRNLSIKQVEKLCQSYNNVDALAELPLQLDILDALNIRAAEHITFICPQCKTEGTAPFRFPRGVKQIFRRISDLESELL